jgi:hypothetical protein
MSVYTKEDIKALREVLKDIPEESHAHATAFARSNHGLSDKEFMEKWEAEMADRAEAAKLEAHRQEKVVQEFMALHPETIAQVVGVVSKGESAATGTKTTH